MLAASDGDAPMNYCLGFLTDASGTQVLLMEKRRPSWQAGRLNGIGGKVEEGEDALGAMRRECQEETGLDVLEWAPLEAISFEGGQVHVFHAQADLDLARSTTDEPVRKVSLSDAIQGRSPLVDEVQTILTKVQALLLEPRSARPPRP